MNSIVVIDKFEGCPYCGTKRLNKMQCCGEIHFETLFEIEIDGKLQDSYFSQSEIDVLKKIKEMFK